MSIKIMPNYRTATQAHVYDIEQRMYNLKRVRVRHELTLLQAVSDVSLMLKPVIYRHVLPVDTVPILITDDGD